MRLFALECECANTWRLLRDIGQEICHFVCSSSYPAKLLWSLHESAQLLSCHIAISSTMQMKRCFFIFFSRKGVVTIYILLAKYRDENISHAIIFVGKFFKNFLLGNMFFFSLMKFLRAHIKVLFFSIFSIFIILLNYKIPPSIMHSDILRVFLWFDP